MFDYDKIDDICALLTMAEIFALLLLGVMFCVLAFGFGWL